MSNLERGSRLSTLIIVMAGLVFAPFAFADDEDDVMAVINQYGASGERGAKRRENAFYGDY